MKKKQVVLSVPQPCHEKWENMTPKDKGAFCKSCAKVVVDFSCMTNSQIIEYLEEGKYQNLCGKFKKHQLDTPLTSYISSPSWYLKAKQFLVGLFLGISLPSFLKAGNLVLPKNNTSIVDQDEQKAPQQIKGLIVDENKEGVPFANIQILLNNKSIGLGTTTDFDGQFTLEISDSLQNQNIEMEITTVDYVKQTIKVDKEWFEIELKPRDIKSIVSNLPNSVLETDTSSAPTQIKENRIINGVVIDKITKEKLINADITVPDFGLEVVTDFDGYFELKIPDSLEITPSTKVEVSHIGMEKREFLLNNLLKEDNVTILMNSYRSMESIVCGGAIATIISYKYIPNDLNFSTLEYFDIKPKWLRLGFASKKEYKESKRKK